MAALWDAVVSRSLAEALDQRLHGARAVALALDRSTMGFALHFREATLDWRLAPSVAGLDLGAARDPEGPAHRLPATVSRIHCLPDERVIVFDLKRVRGRVREVGLQVELLPGRENLIMTEGETRKVIRWLRPPPPSDGRLTVGQPYRPPPPSERAGAGEDLSLEQWTALVHAPQATEGDVLERLAWTSRFNVAHLREAPPEEGYRLWRTLSGREESLEAQVLRSGRGRIPYPVALPGLAADPVPSILDAFQRVSSATALPGQDTGTTTLQREARRLEKQMAALERQLDKHNDAQTLRERGDLLLARLNQIPSGASEVVLEGFDGSSVTLSLDPTRGPAENADAYYDKAARSERARKKLPKRIAGAKRSLTEINKAMEAIRNDGFGAEDFSHLMPGRKGSKSRSDKPSALPYKVFVTSGKLEVRVGRNSKRNDELTFRHSSPEDVWLHARHVGGSHVVLRWQSKDAPPARDIAEAAVLAAFHSKARHAGTVPVDWTRRKYVRKPRGAKSGSVTIEREKTVFVKPDPAVVERLSSAEDT